MFLYLILALILFLNITIVMVFINIYNKNRSKYEVGILQSLIDKKTASIVDTKVKAVYENLTDKMHRQELQLDNSIDGLREYRKELEQTYNSLVSNMLAKERMLQELAVAARIQEKLIPTSVEKIPGLDMAEYFEPAKEIGGDYYDYTRLSDGGVAITIADVSGKGVPAAFLMALGRSILKTLLKTTNESASIDLANMNKILYPDVAEDMFITMMHGKYYPDKKILKYSNAGHTPLLVYFKEKNTVESCTVKGVALGFMDEYKFKEGEIALNSGDIVLFYTDGVTETFNDKREMFGFEKIKEILYNSREKNAHAIKEDLLAEVRKFRGNVEQEDDLTFVILKCD